MRTLVLWDIDGTLISDEGQLNPRTIGEISRLVERGHVVGDEVERVLPLTPAGRTTVGRAAERGTALVGDRVEERERVVAHRRHGSVIAVGGERCPRDRRDIRPPGPDRRSRQV